MLVGVFLIEHGAGLLFHQDRGGGGDGEVVFAEGRQGKGGGKAEKQRKRDRGETLHGLAPPFRSRGLYVHPMRPPCGICLT